MKIIFLRPCLYFIALLLTFISVKAAPIMGNDTNEVKKINRQAFDNRLTNPKQTIIQARKALALAEKLEFSKGVAEANRELGIGYYYINQPDSAIQYYLTAKKFYDDTHDLKGQSRVLNNIGNLYRETDYDQAIVYFKEALNVAKALKDDDLVATCYLNLGTAYLKKKSYTIALDDYKQSYDLFTKTKNDVLIIQCLQNLGVIYYEKHELDTAKALLLQANQRAIERDLNSTVAGTNITLVRIFLAQGQFEQAKQYYNQGQTYVDILKTDRMQHDYKFLRYEMLFKLKDYKGALENLRDIYKQDSTSYIQNESVRLTLREAGYKQNEQDQKNLQIIAQQKYSRTLFIASSIVAALLAVVIFLLVNNVNRKAKINKHLTELNEQISEQKENLNQINHHLEEIIDERTKDLQVKNKKLADYSLHLSHQIRGPIATLKGLLNLERDKLIEQEECIKLMNKCVSDIDENIIDMSGMLHESSKVKPNTKA
ncbi:tetratricopeptide repeat protein [Mucilaginibacter sp. HMF5004]|uniref:tetratricopeptide repeat protein n=1 Tax=Mucilaginibacter rivuli TaxID=2857527 RepID=UPI001C5F2672|nr:tetratricopeptide repeat protein [Mucilaginibacter rivuli]MBW4889931.1 tetratricopeptide repeat protein [Mucilaginibacter rivuli]